MLSSVATTLSIQPVKVAVSASIDRSALVAVKAKNVSERVVLSAVTVSTS
jgi:hypothetical protein